jgi:hypothetical protein
MSITLGSTDDLLVPFSDSVDVADLHKKNLLYTCILHCVPRTLTVRIKGILRMGLEVS